MPKLLLKKLNEPLINKRFISISKAAKILQVSKDTLRNWEKEGKLIPARTKGGARRYSTSELLILKKEIHPFTTQKKGLLSISQAAKALEVSKDTLRNWDKGGFIESQRTKGKARRFTRTEISRLQKELGIQPKPVEITKDFEEAALPNSGLEIHKFSFPWPEIISSSIGIVLILAAGLLFKSYIDLQQKAGETTNLIKNLAKSIESLQSGVYGIQTEMIPSPIPTSSPSPIITYPQPAPSLIQSVSFPITLDKGVIGCKDCLTSPLNYLSGIENSDGSLNINIQEKKAKVSLEVNHTNNWSANQIFSGGAIFNGENVGIGTTTPTEGKLVISDDGLKNLPSIYINTQQTATTSAVLSIASATTNGSGANTVKFKVTADGSVYTDSVFSTPADLAEMYPVKGEVAEGDLVELIEENSGFAVQKATKTSYNKLFGVISTNPGTVLGYDVSQAAVQKPVALAGRVPIKVSDENGPIKVGDYLTSSSIPGVAVKAKSPGIVIGQALEVFDGGTIESEEKEEGHLYYLHVRIGKILSFVNLSFADPDNFLASLSLDDQGNLIIPKLKVGSIILDQSVVSASASLTANNGQLITHSSPVILEGVSPIGADSIASLQNDKIFYDLSGKIASIEERVKSLESRIEELTKNTSGAGSPVPSVVERDASEVKTGEASASATLAATTSATSSAALGENKLGLTPPDILIATSSATLANVKVTDTLSSERLFSAQDSKISGQLSVFGKTTLANTTVAGDLTVDGTLSLENGNEINVIGAVSTSDGIANTSDGGRALSLSKGEDSSEVKSGILYLQKSSLAQGLDILNGKVIIDKLGNLRAQIVTVSEFRVITNKISGNGKILAGTKSVDLENILVKSSSRILITPTSETNLVLAVTDKVEGKKFTVSSPQITDKDIIFDWFMINESYN